MNSKPALKLAWVDNAAALYAVKNWHYSKSLPTAPVLRIGVWEDAQFIGAVCFSRGASPHLGKAYGLQQTDLCELTRVALKKHKTMVTRILKIAISLLRKQCPRLKIIVSFADSNEGHHGGIYQGGNWVYTGMTAPKFEYVDRFGKRWHDRQVSENGLIKQYGKIVRCPKMSDCKKVHQQGKHRYVMPLDSDMKAVVERMRKPYPKRAASIGVDAPGFQPGESGSRPTAALHSLTHDGSGMEAEKDA